MILNFYQLFHHTVLTILFCGSWLSSLLSTTLDTTQIIALTATLCMTLSTTPNLYIWKFIVLLSRVIMKSEKSLDWWSWNLFPHQVHFLFHFEFEQQWSYSLNPRKICWTRVSSVNINKMTILHQNQSLQNMSHVTWLTCMGDHLVASSSSYFCLSLIELWPTSLVTVHVGQEAASNSVFAPRFRYLSIFTHFRCFQF